MKRREDKNRTRSFSACAQDCGVVISLIGLNDSMLNSSISKYASFFSFFSFFFNKIIINDTEVSGYYFKLIRYLFSSPIHTFFPW